MTENLLGRETSPYLLQHADNPVHWRPWGPEALALAGRENKPVLMSIGYAACHWCHVMAHESFEDPATAALMNELFVNVKVDREERPDLDTIYQHALQLMGQQGGWPLTMFLDAEGKPFWGGTYFPPDDRFGRPGFKRVLAAVASFYREKPDKAAESAAGLTGALGALGRSSPGGTIPIRVNDQAASRLAKEFDKVHGGIGGAPKFPNPSVLQLLWRAWRRTGDAECRDAVLLTLDRMSQGGIYDHLGGGYARYATDGAWLVPHFEKMLYDNAQLIELLTAAWQDTGSPLYAARVRETAEWMLREMIAEGGGFAATLDADSEGEEGRFYVWTEGQIDDVLGEDAAPFKRAYDVRPGGNWEGRSILNRNHDAGSFDAAAEARLADCRARLLAERGKRVRPGWDDKVLADWNGLAIAALAHAGVVFDAPGWIDAAAAAFRFVSETMRPDGRLRHSSRGGRARHAATLDDYANMAGAATVLFEVTGERGYLDRAAEWAATLEAHYADAEGGGYFLTADDAEALIVRTKSAADNATPSGNGAVAGVLARLYYLTGEDRYRARAEATVAAFAGEVERNVFPLATLLNGSELLQRATQVVIAGEHGEANFEALRRAAFAAPLPTRLISAVAPGGDLPPAHPAHGKGPVKGRAAAYVCAGPTCSPPILEAEELRRALAP